MKKILLAAALCSCLLSRAQNVGVGTANPLNKLHVAGGLRLDTLAGVSGNGIVTHNASGVIYGLKFSGSNGDVLRGDGSFGPPPGGAGGTSGWALTGNGGTSTATSFIGTTDNASLVFRIRNLFSGIIDSARRNTALGYRSLFSNTTGSENVAFGFGALTSNLSGGNNAALGVNALKSNTAGFNNAAVGWRAMEANKGSDNTAMGTQSLLSNITGDYNSAFGSAALVLNQTGYYNTAVGAAAAYTNVSGHDNTAMGANAMVGNKGSFNTSIGAFSMYGNGNGGENTAVGYKAMEQSTGSFYNTAVGFGALQGNNNGVSNCAFGHNALSRNKSGGGVAMGVDALFKNTDGYGNTAIGTGALYTITTGSFNTAIGYNAGNGSNPANPNATWGLPPTASNTTCLGYGAGFITTSSNQVNVGNFSVTWIGGQVPWGTYSDQRMKHDIRDEVPGLAFISRLRPVTYYIDLAKQKEIAGADPKDGDWEGKHDIEQRKMTGFLAQDVEAAARAAGFEFSGVHAPKNGQGLYSLEYSTFVVPLVKAVQEQQQLIDRQQKLIEALLKRVEALEKNSSPLK